MALAGNPKHHERTKHIDIRYHYIREAVQDNLILLEHISTYDNIADLLTKPLSRDAHQRHAFNPGLRPLRITSPPLSTST